MENPTRLEAPSLKDLCLKVFLEDLISKATPSTVKYVRDGIKYWQAVTKGRRGERDFRDQCMEKLNENFFTDVLEGANKKEHIPLHVCAVLDCLLSDNLTVLELRLPYEYIKSFSSLMTVIARRSPKLKDLVIKFFSISFLSEEPLNDWPPTKKMKKTSDSRISLLHDLTNLSLRYEESGPIGPPLRFADDPTRQSILSTVGERCPSLEKLWVSGFRYQKQDLLGLILGDVADVLFPLDNEGWSEDSVLGSLWIPQEFMKPLCFTLKKLTIVCLCNDLTECTHRSFSQAVYAFVFRHLRKLYCNQYFGSRCFPDIISPQLFEFLKKGKNEFQQAKFEEACMAAASAHVGLDRHVIGPFSYVSGSISIGLLLGVPIDDRLMMHDAGTIFRNATVVSFEGNKSYSGRISLSAHSSTSDHSSLFDDETDAFLRECWPNVECIDFFDIGCRACVKTILNALGPKLKRIHFTECSELDLLDLIPCNILEALTIGVDCSIVTDAGGPVYEYLNSQPFLPALKKFTSYSCLENWSSLFERKASLTELRMNCSHIGIGVITIPDGIEFIRSQFKYAPIFK